MADTHSEETVTEKPSGPSLAEEAAAQEAAAGTTDNPVLPSDGGTPPVEGELIAGKFKSHEELEKAYKELEAKLGTPTPAGETTPATTEAPKGGEFAIPDAAEPGAPLNAEFMQQLSESYSANDGKLTDEDYQALEAKGVDRGLADTIVRAVVADAANTRTAIVEDLGGQEAVDAHLQWAAANYSDDQKAAFAAAQTGSEVQIRDAMLALKARFEVANGKEPSANFGGSGGDTGGDIYGSKDELHNDMRDPRYKKDPVFQKMVMDKTRRSMKSGNLD